LKAEEARILVTQRREHSEQEHVHRTQRREGCEKKGDVAVVQ
jgi:hypothetical protein